MSNLQIDAERLWTDLMETARIGALPNGGVARLTLSDDDRRVRDWFRAQVEALGLTVTVDEVGNMFALRAGFDPAAMPIAMGSHLDTQPTGGKFDGALGVLAGLEVLRTFHAAGYVTNAPLMLVNWTNEEGSRFSPAMLGSGVYAGAYDRAFADSRADADGRLFGAALDAIGYRGSARAGFVAFGAMFELHIEQGPILEAEERRIGIVQGVQGMRWYDVIIMGQASHTGTTPMTHRADALLGAARIVVAVEAIAGRHAPTAVASVGFLSVTPNSHNVIAGQVVLTVDLRDPNDAVLDAMELELRDAVASLIPFSGLAAEIRPISRVSPVVFDPACIASVRRAVEKSGFSARDIVSGAGHDSAHTAAKVPTTMIFVPSVGGLSHNEAEFTSREDCAAGAQVLLDAVLDYDRRAEAP